MTHLKVLSEKTTFKVENAFEVRKLSLELPSRKKLTHYIAQRVPVSVIFPLTNKYELYLISQYRYLLKKTIIEAVSGRIDDGESALFAAKRELMEEAGIEAGQIEQLTKIELAGSFFRGQVSLFLAQDLTLGEQELEETEHIEVIKMPLSQAVEKVMNGEIQAAATIIGILMLNQLRREKKL